jgi:hypothetical protein
MGRRHLLDGQSANYGIELSGRVVHEGRRFQSVTPQKGGHHLAILTRSENDKSLSFGEDRLNASLATLEGRVMGLKWHLPEMKHNF